MDNYMVEPHYVAGVLIDYERFDCDPEYRQEIEIQYKINPEFRKLVDNANIEARILMSNPSPFPLVFSFDENIKSSWVGSTGWPLSDRI